MQSLQVRGCSQEPDPRIRIAACFSPFFQCRLNPKGPLSVACMMLWHVVQPAGSRCASHLGTTAGLKGQLGRQIITFGAKYMQARRPRLPCLRKFRSCTSQLGLVVPLYQVGSTCSSCRTGACRGGVQYVLEVKSTQASPCPLMCVI